MGVRATLAVNVGSSSVKCALFTLEAEPRALGRTTVDGHGPAAVARLLQWTDTQDRDVSLAAVGHRLVHGGPRYRAHQLVTVPLLNDLHGLIPLAPDHLPGEIALIEEFARLRPEIPQVACFDTVFHHTLPEVSRRFALPAAHGGPDLQRYGFHGLSYTYLIEELRRLVGQEAAAGKVILAHLGHGSSLAAVLQGRSLDTTMGFTPIGGVIMSTRSGDLDPGVLIYLGRTARLSFEDMEDLLSQQAGRLGLSGVSGDMRVLLEREATEPACQLAVAAYVHSVKKAIGALTASLGGLDLLVFSGGIGEQAPAIRGRICEGLGFLGIEIDWERNGRNAPVISSDAARVETRVIQTNEELVIARAAYQLLA